MKLDLSPGLEYQSHGITRPGWTRDTNVYDPPLSDSSYDADSGVWEIGDYVDVGSATRLPPYVLTLTARVGADAAPGEQCLTATMTAFPAEPGFVSANYPMAADNTARVCLGLPPASARVLLQHGPNTGWAVYPCVNKTAYPCVAGTNNLVIAVTSEPNDSGIQDGTDPRLAAAGAGMTRSQPNPWPSPLRPEQAIFQIPDPAGRVIDDRNNGVNSGGTVSWQTADDWECDHGVCFGQSSHRDGVQTAESYIPFNDELADWGDIIVGLTVRGAGGGPPPGRVIARYSFDDSVFFNPAPPTYSDTYPAYTLTTESSAYVVMIEFEKLGTYELEYTASATRSATGGTPCGGTATCTGSGTSLFHVGPVAELAVRDGGDGSVGAPPGKTAFSIVAVNNVPDAIGAGAENGLGAQVLISLPAGARGCAAEDECYNAATGVWRIGTMPAPPRFASPAYNSGQVSEEVLTIVCDGPGLAGQTARAVISNTAPYVVATDGDRHKRIYLNYYEGNDSVAIRGCTTARRWWWRNRACPSGTGCGWRPGPGAG